MSTVPERARVFKPGREHHLIVYCANAAHEGGPFDRDTAEELARLSLLDSDVEEVELYKGDELVAVYWSGAEEDSAEEA